LFFTFEQDKKFIGMNDFNKSTKMFNSSVMRFNNEVMSKYVWQEYLSDKKTFDKLQGDQNVISQTIKKHHITYLFLMNGPFQQNGTIEMYLGLIKKNGPLREKTVLKLQYFTVNLIHTNLLIRIHTNQSMKTR
jgi:hypothetical protein